MSQELYRCNHCRSYFLTKVDYQLHRIDIHKGKHRSLRRCNTCGSEIMGHKPFWTHVNTARHHHDTPQYEEELQPPTVQVSFIGSLPTTSRTTAGKVTKPVTVSKAKVSVMEQPAPHIYRVVTNSSATKQAGKPLTPIADLPRIPKLKGTAKTTPARKTARSSCRPAKEKGAQPKKPEDDYDSLNSNLQDPLDLLA